MQPSEQNPSLLGIITPGREYEFVEGFVFDAVIDHDVDEFDQPDSADNTELWAARADQVEHAYAENPAVLAALMQFRLDYLIKWDGGIAALYAAIGRWPDIAAIRLKLAQWLIGLKRFDEAEIVLQPLVDGRCVEALDTIYDLALTQHLAGKHRDGLRLLEACRQISPEIELNPSFAKVRRVANELKHLTVPFDATKRLRLDRALRNVLWTMAVLGVLLALWLVGLGIGSAYRGYHAEVFVVNGLDRDYTVMLNGAPYKLPAHGYRKLDIAEDDISVAVPELPAITPAVAPVHRSFFTRLRQPAMFVINPDCGAILEETVPLHPQYAFAESEKHQRYVAGKTLLRFGHIDLPFEGLPFKDSMERQLSLQTRLTLLQQRYGFTVERFLPPVANELPHSELIAILQTQIRLDADPQPWQAALSVATQTTTQP